MLNAVFILFIEALNLRAQFISVQKLITQKHLQSGVRHTP